MTRWIDDILGYLTAGTPCALVTVLTVEGSAPREPGARMVVSKDGLEGTIGGGQLEFEAADLARSHLKSACAASQKRYPLGPELGQCCGGAVTLMFEPYSPADRAWVEQLKARAVGPQRSVRLVELTGEGNFKRSSLTGTEVLPTGDAWIERQLSDLLAGEGSGCRVRLEGDACTLIESLGDVRQPLWLFGAGHVGRAVAEALSPLPFTVTWIDSRADEFPEPLPSGIQRLVSAMPELAVDEAPAGTMFLVMTHSHGLDQDICEAVLRRSDAAYLGLIGSATKAARFRSRLRAKGLEESAMAAMQCPIGLPGVTGKAPSVIAASVAADLLIRLEHKPADARKDSRVGGSLDV